MYAVFTQWITLSVLFFLGDYVAEAVQVVTLGGLVAGAFIFGAWMTLLTKLCRRLPPFTGKAAVLAGVCLGAQFLTQLLPGYSIALAAQPVLFLLAYGAAAIIIERILNINEV